MGDLSSYEPSLWNLAHRILTRGGYKVCGAPTPADAVRQATLRASRIT